MSFAAERRDARERALGLLYEAEAKGTTGAAVIAELPVAPAAYAVTLVGAVDDHLAEIDRHLERFAKGWTLARMAALDRAALRMGTAELLTQPDVPTGVVLAETVELAARFSTDGSSRFVNGLLARVAEEVRTREAAPEVVPAAEARTPLVEGMVIDLDGVIRHWDGNYLADHEARLGLPTGALGAAAFEPDRLQRAMDGRLPFEGWAEEIGAAVAGAHPVDGPEVAAAWALASWDIDLTVVELLQDVRTVVPVALLSNASSRLVDDLEASGIDDAFDAVVGSADIGVTKPNAESYRAAAERLGVAVERCCFVDDLEENVQAAKVLGMRALRYEDVEGLRSFLQELGLL